LAYLYRAPDGLFVNLEIVRQGYGHAYTRFPFKYLNLFREYEKKAREAGRGLWGEKSTTGKADPPTTGDDPNVTVYVTRTGKKYHRGSCRYLRASKIPISLNEAKERYEPCPVCRPLE
jgi:micrococcal nuclease